MQLYKYFAVRISGKSLFVGIKYTRLKSRLIKSKFKKKINFDQVFGTWNNANLYTIYMLYIHNFPTNCISKILFFIR